MELELQELISKYFKNIADLKVSEFGSGLINRTFFLQHNEGQFLLQKINHHVFKNPAGLMNNISIVSNHLLKKKYPKSIITIIPTISGHLFYKTKNGNYWRIFNFIKNTQSYDIPTSSEMVYQASKNFGEFLFYLNDIPKDVIVDTIPDFHNTVFRFQQFQNSVQKDIVKRVNSSSATIQRIESHHSILLKIKELKTLIPSRIIHNDLKINNLLFSKDNSVKAIIDWDTIMKGNILYDFGDMVRTMACTENEESTNFNQVRINKKYLKEIVKGFSESTFSFLSEIEKENLLAGAQFIIYEQAIRFLTDHLNGDQYYSITYPNQNLNRAINQLTLLDDLLKMKMF